MAIRVNQETFYRQTVFALLRMREGEALLNGQIASGKRIGAPSDDAVGSIIAQYSHRGLEELVQYKRNLGHLDDWLKQSATTMAHMSDLAAQARTLAEQMATGTYTGEQRQAMANQVRDFLAHFVQLGNTQVNGRYIFGGSRTDAAPALAAPSAENPAQIVGSHSAEGRLYGTGSYAGKFSRNVSLTVAAGYAGGAPSALNPMEVDYSYVDDYGRTITGSVTLTGAGSGYGVDVGDGARIYCDGNAFAAGDQYTLQIHRQQGNGQDLYASLASNSRMQYNYHLDDLFQAEGHGAGGFGNLLDRLAAWADALDKDSQVQDYFEPVPAIGNDRASSAQPRVMGDYTQLNARKYQFVAGGPIQSDDADETALRNYRNFSVDLAYPGGAPDAANPMTLNYEYWDGAAWQADTVIVTGAGGGAAVGLAGGYGATIYVLDAAYTAGEALPLEIHPALPAPPAPLPAPPPADAPVTPSAGEPVTLTYTYLDAGVRRWASVTFTGSGDDPANTLSLNPPGEASLKLNPGATLNDGDAWDLSLAQYGQGQAASQEMVAELESLQAKLLRYAGDAGAKLNRIESRTSFMESDALRLNDRLERVEDADIAEVTTQLKTYEVMYQAALQATALVSSKTLADYL
ncbi:MAG: hypothetical protein ACOZHQ_11860 [Thermodesulfobacteriota bacterium]